MAAIMHRRGGGGGVSPRRSVEQDSFDSSQRSTLGGDSSDDDNSNYHRRINVTSPSNSINSPSNSKSNTSSSANINFHAKMIKLQTTLSNLAVTTYYKMRILQQRFMAWLRHPDLPQQILEWLRQPENWILIGMGFFLLLWILTILKTFIFPSSSTSSSLFGPSRNSAFELAYGPDGVEYHMIFSTGCSTFQDWQSYVFFYHAWKSGQPGHVTRIVSGCGEDDERLLRRLHKEQIEIMSPGRFHLHFTPEYSTVKPGVNFKYFNKPFGLRHWMEHALGYPRNHEHDDAVIMLLDPDQIVLRPFTKDFTNSTEVWMQPNLGKLKVERGQIFGQKYGFGPQWKTKVNMSHVSPHRHSPVEDVSVEDAGAYYAAGPPYVATGYDMYRIAKTWSDFAPAVHDEYPYLLAEMFAYCIAAAHLKLPHQMATGFMVSDVTDSKGEGWELIDKYPKNDVCYVPKEQLPHVLHYCQRYNLGKWHFGKFGLRKDFISCESSLLMEPPPDIASQYIFSVSPNNELNIWRYPHTGKRNGFMLCMIIKALNDAAIFYKQHHCAVGTANFVKNYTFQKHMEIEQKWLDQVQEELKKKPMMDENTKMT